MSRVRVIVGSRRLSSRCYHLVLAVQVAGAIGVSPCSAQGTWRPSLRLDNDVYNFWQRHTRRPDEEYTNGVHASLASQTAPWWGARLAGGLSDCAAAPTGVACRSTLVTLGQDLYTPHLDRTPRAVPDWERERPYFAWLFLRGTAQVSTERTLHATSLSLGVTGPPAGGSLAQDIAHRIGFNEQADGWDTQIGFEPGVILEYRRRQLAARWNTSDGVIAELAPQVAVSLGNVRTHAEVGGALRWGGNLSHPWHAPRWRGRATSEWWVSAAAHADYVARDMSLDGTLINPTRRVARVPTVLQYAFGAGLRVHGVMLEYRAVTRSREYRTGPAHHTYSSMIVSLTPP